MATNETESKTCTVRKKVLVGAHVEIELWTPVSRWRTKPERYAESLERAVKDFQEFLRDHRSQDVTGMSVEREYEDQCSACGAKWESERYTDTGEEYCCNCGATVTTEGQD